MTIGVYLIRNTVNGKVYVGSSSNVEKRFGDHKRHLRRGAHTSCHLQEAWKLYGEESFVFTLKMECEENRLLEVEQEYMDLYLSSDGDCGYNICEKAGRPPSRKGIPKSPETRRRMSDAAKSRPPEYWKKCADARRGAGNHMFGKKHSPEMIEVYRQKATGKKHTEEAKAKIKEWNRLNNRRRGVSLSHEEKMQRSVATAMFTPEDAKKMREMRNGGYFWREIAAFFNCSQSCARRVVHGERLAYATDIKAH